MIEPMKMYRADDYVAVQKATYDFGDMTTSENAKIEIDFKETKTFCKYLIDHEKYHFQDMRSVFALNVIGFEIGCYYSIIKSG